MILEIKEKLDTDIEAAYNGDLAVYSKAEIIVSYSGTYVGMVHRIAHELYLLSVPLIPRIMSEYAHNVTVYQGASILGGDTIIGEGVVISGNAFVVRSIPEKTCVSVKNPELQYKNNNISTHIELDQKEFWFYEI